MGGGEKPCGNSGPLPPPSPPLPFCFSYAFLSPAMRTCVQSVPSICPRSTPRERPALPRGGGGKCPSRPVLPGRGAPSGPGCRSILSEEEAAAAAACSWGFSAGRRARRVRIQGRARRRSGAEGARPGGEGVNSRRSWCRRSCCSCRSKSRSSSCCAGGCASVGVGRERKMPQRGAPREGGRGQGNAPGSHV